MDIFDFPKRTKNQSITKPLNYPQGDKSEARLADQNRLQLQQFNTFLTNLYLKFDFKINKCKYTCISQAHNYRQVGQCQQKCQEGVSKFSSYVDSRMVEMQQLLGDCVANASTLYNTMDQIYYCYEMYNNGFGKLKQFIAQESLFYQ